MMFNIALWPGSNTLSGRSSAETRGPSWSIAPSTTAHTLRTGTTPSLVTEMLRRSPERHTWPGQRGASSQHRRFDRRGAQVHRIQVSDSMPRR